MALSFSLFDSLQSPVWIFDIEKKKIVWVNTAALPLWESHSKEELLARNFSHDMSQAVTALLNHYQDCFYKKETIKTWWSFTPNHILKRALCHFSGIELEDKSMGMLVQVIAEESSLRRELAFSNCSNLALLFDETGQLLSKNEAFRLTYGHHLVSLNNFLGDENLAEKWIKKAQKNTNQTYKHLCWTGKSHHWFNLETHWLSQEKQLLLHLTNISQEVETLKQAKYNAEHNYLTGLLNRRGITKAIQKSHHKDHPYSVLFLDIDGFKMINDTYGHSIGDKLLRAIALRLQETLNYDGLLARFGGDEFLIQVKHQRIPNVELFSQRIIHELNRPFHLKSVGELSIGCSIGIARFPADADNIETLITQADMAMRQAKIRGRNCSHYFTPAMANALHRKMLLRHHLNAAFEHNNFELYYQPIVKLSDQKLKGFEVLMRWNDNELGQISPAEFISLAEETGQIIELGQWVLKTACKQLEIWKKKYNVELMVSVNISKIQLQPNLAPMVKQLLKTHKIKPSQFALELTESTMMQDYDDAKQSLVDLAALGIELYLDDFGTGYSSLSQLQDLPITTVKLDRCFVQGTHQGSQAICKATYAICKALGLKVVAEGVEEQEQLDWLNELGFDYGQGFYLAKPMPTTDLERIYLQPLLNSRLA